jgi:hypothetical protein
MRVGDKTLLLLRLSASSGKEAWDRFTSSRAQIGRRGRWCSRACCVGA